MTETETIEFKEKLNDKFEKEVVGFLNTNHGGSIYIGLDNQGKPVGITDIDDTELQIKDRIKNNILPSTIGLFEIVTSPKLDYIQVIISGGNQKPYYIKKYGMCPEGCYIRIGTSAEKLDEQMIIRLFQQHDKSTLKSLMSYRQDLTFVYLKQAYANKGFETSDNFIRQLELYEANGKFNLLAYLLSDQFSSPIQYARYEGDDVFDLKEQKIFSNQSIIKTTSELLDFIQSRNTTFTEITPINRIDKQKFNSIAVRELVVNAIVHNDYRGNGLPKFEEFSNRLEISSFGGLPYGFTKEDFLKGYSLPVNPELIRVFRDLGYAERLGTGIRRVLKFYPKDIFSFSPNFLRVSVPFAKEKTQAKEPQVKGNTVIDVIRANTKVTRKELAQILGKSESSIYRELSQLVKDGLIRRVGSNKSGSWKILNIKRPN